MTPRALLVSLRDPHDPMAAHERRCFALRADLPEAAVDVHPMTEGRPDPGRVRTYDAVFFGGSGAYSVLDDVPWIRAGLDTVLEVLDLRRPAWASCFGFQGLSLALGGEVVRDDARQELGAVALALTPAGEADPLVSVLPRAFWGQEGHHDHVDRLPDGVTLLATGQQIPNQAFRVDGAPFYASQFHPELTSASTIERFVHYQSLYQAPGSDAEVILATLRAGEDTPEMAQLLARLVRGQYAT
ncbi:MAG: type 1 glutamine amidotransferase [Myxococcota bacterium]